ncbi:hypothetical protein Hanom_Chr02g00097091 [Helianthus anomalus]
MMVLARRAAGAEDHPLPWLLVVCVFRVPDCSLQTSARPENHHLVSRNVRNKEKEPSNDGDSSGVSQEYIINMWRSSVFHNHDRCRRTLSREQKLASYYNRIMERMARDEAKIVDVSTAEDRAATRALINRWFNYVPSDNSETEGDSTDSD